MLTKQVQRAQLTPIAWLATTAVLVCALDAGAAYGGGKLVAAVAKQAAIDDNAVAAWIDLPVPPEHQEPNDALYIGYWGYNTGYHVTDGSWALDVQGGLRVDGMDVGKELRRLKEGCK